MREWPPRLGERPSTRLALAAALAGAILLVLPGGPSRAGYADPPCRGANKRPIHTTVYRMEHAIHCLINQARRHRGLRRLRHRDSLHDPARSHSRRMARRNFFAHSNLMRSTRRYRAGRSSWTVGENIAWNTGGSATARNIFRAWMRSSGHRANILRPGFRDLGVGVAKGAPRRASRSMRRRSAVYTTLFGQRGG